MWFLLAVADYARGVLLKRWIYWNTLAHYQILYISCKINFSTFCYFGLFCFTNLSRLCMVDETHAWVLFAHIWVLSKLDAHCRVSTFTRLCT